MIKTIFLPLSIYLAIWWLSVNCLSATTLGLFGFPLYFEITSLYLPLLFLLYLFLHRRTLLAKKEQENEAKVKSSLESKKENKDRRAQLEPSDNLDTLDKKDGGK